MILLFWPNHPPFLLVFFCFFDPHSRRPGFSLVPIVQLFVPALCFPHGNFLENLLLPFSTFGGSSPEQDPFLLPSSLSLKHFFRPHFLHPPFVGRWPCPWDPGPFFLSRSRFCFPPGPAFPLREGLRLTQRQVFPGSDRLPRSRFPQDFPMGPPFL